MENLRSSCSHTKVWHSYKILSVIQMYLKCLVITLFLFPIFYDGNLKFSAY